jgi:hypothetical protein
MKLYEAKKDLLFDLAQKHHGNLKLIADNANLTVRQAQAMYKGNKEFKEVVDAARDALYEDAEVKLVEKIQSGSFQALQLFFSKSPQAKARGWGERTEQVQEYHLTDAEKAAAAKQMLGIEDSDKPDV